MVLGFAEHANPSVPARLDVVVAAINPGVLPENDAYCILRAKHVLYHAAAGMIRNTLPLSRCFFAKNVGNSLPLRPTSVFVELFLQIRI